MDFTSAVKTCLLQKYATFDGRASRPEYWWFFLAVMIGAFVAMLLGPLSFVYGLAMICPMLAAGARRLHDTGRAGWWIALPTVLNAVTGLVSPQMPSDAQIAEGIFPDSGRIILSGVLGLLAFAATLLLLWWLSRPSDPGPNAYGPPPARARPAA